MIEGNSTVNWCRKMEHTNSNRPISIRFNNLDGFCRQNALSLWNILQATKRTFVRISLKKIELNFGVTFVCSLAHSMAMAIQLYSVHNGNKRDAKLDDQVVN